ncbi:MAG TPA: hypothetical protein VGO43_14230, partial [Pyrinomonadaceae bacterium]|nr:hypothetical protein [Pyrinomonadaceae bacterium]
MLTISRIFMIVAAFAVYYGASLAQKKCGGRYELSGQLVDTKGHFVSGGEVYVEPDRWGKQFGRFIESTSTDAQGRFQVNRNVVEG